ncbi:glyoxalase [Rhodococcus sp. 1163]|uniref:VOC family protein n=1 Tax=Rhodococcus sp. 1163 TaxID=1905289 RepID=UPI000A053F3B|nr:VOC family protein [Rhodococcus sp. 1163]ORI17807.1 glyoxalase [Rhodococcus sp. 1163]
MDIKLELVMIPVSDVDRAKDFYVKIGFNADHDERPTDEIRFVQLTPPGSACSIAIGEGITTAAPGSVEGMQVVVASAEQAREHLIAAGLDVDPVVDLGWGKFVFFADPDGNKWAVQELPDYAHKD